MWLVTGFLPDISSRHRRQALHIGFAVAANNVGDNLYRDFIDSGNVIFVYVFF